MKCCVATNLRETGPFDPGYIQDIAVVSPDLVVN